MDDSLRLRTVFRELYRAVTYIALVCLLACSSWIKVSAQDKALFDHDYVMYAELLRDHVVGTRVDYSTLLENQSLLKLVLKEFGKVSELELADWSDRHKIAYWINAYNVFTLKAIIDNYPIKGSWFSLSPRNSIRQISGVWDDLQWEAGGQTVTLDQIEHEILRQQFKEPRIHFAINCASISCPALKPKPYRADLLDQQLSLATRNYLASDLGLQIDEMTLHVSSIFNWYGNDFISKFSGHVDANRENRDLAILGVIAQYGPREAANLAQKDHARIRFLDYNWSLNDIFE